MSSLIQNISVDCADPYSLCEFWSRVLDMPMDPDDSPGDEEVGFMLDERQALLFMRVPEPKTVKNRMHLCLQPQTRRDEEVDRLLGIGASMVGDHRRADGTGWAVLADPEGNEFCVLRSEQERAGTS